MFLTFQEQIKHNKEEKPDYFAHDEPDYDEEEQQDEQEDYENQGYEENQDQEEKEPEEDRNPGLEKQIQDIKRKEEMQRLRKYEDLIEENEENGIEVVHFFYLFRKNYFVPKSQD